MAVRHGPVSSSPVKTLLLLVPLSRYVSLVDRETWPSGDGSDI